MTQPPKAKIYTKTGDQGQTRLVDGSCVEKFNPRVEAYGTLDELNSCLGIVRSSLNEASLKSLDVILFQIQNDLFRLGSLMACEKEEIFRKLPQIEQKHIEFLEKQIDQLTAELPELKNFIIPAGHLITSQLHLSRTVCRRSERRCAEVLIKDQRHQNSLIYLNRLSDFLFTSARWVQLQLGLPEVIWNN
jgi:cob(I)alamin adenosyltransferase